VVAITVDASEDRVWALPSARGGELGAIVFAGFVSLCIQSAFRIGDASPPMVAGALAGATLVEGSG